MIDPSPAAVGEGMYLPRFAVNGLRLVSQKRATGALESRSRAPIHGKTVLDYGVRYTGTADDQPQS